MKKIYQETNPNNSRIFMDFDKKEVIFEYPKKDNLFFKLSYELIIFPIFLYLLMICLSLPIVLIQKGINPYFDVSIFLSRLWFIELIVILVLYFSTILIFINNKRMLRLYPFLGENMHRLFNNINYKYIKIDKLKSKKYEIPIFDNVFFEVRYYGDFKKYKKSLKIIEYDFYYVEKSIFKGVKKNKQDSYWKAILEFKHIPEKGYMEIFFL